MSPFRPPHRSAHDIVSDEARRRDSRRDETIPPAPPTPAPIPVDVELTPQARHHRSIRPLDPGKLKGWIEVLVLIGGLSANGFLWFQNRASKQDVADAQVADAKACTEAIKKALEPIVTELQAGKKRDAKNDRRWDGLDDWHHGLKLLNPPNKTTLVRMFGPKAELHGAIRYDDGDEE